MGTRVVERFAAEGGKRLIEALSEFRLLAGLDGVPAHLAAVGELLEVTAGESFITQNDPQTDIFLLSQGR